MSADLVAFLRARWIEEEQAAIAAADGVAFYADGTRFPHWSANVDALMAATEEGRTELVTEFDRYAAPMLAHIVGWDPARVLAEVAAKRAILDRLVHEPTIGIRNFVDRGEVVSQDYVACACGWREDVRRGQGDMAVDRHLYETGYDESVTADVVRLLVQPYAGHSDFDPSWRVAPAQGLRAT
jgi:hypothetical protein